MTTTPGNHPRRDGSLNGPGSSPTINPIEIPPEHDPRLVDGARTRRQRLAQLSPVERAALVLERYPELRALPSCDWQRLSVQASFSVLFGESARHYAKLELAALAGILASAGVSAAYAKELEIAARRVLELVRRAFGLATPRAITRDVWEAWGRDADLTQTLVDRVAKYAAAVNLYQADYRERLSQADQVQVGHLLLPPLPKQFRQRFVPVAERRVEAQRKRKSKTDVVSECAMAILALMLARYPSMERFIRWYRRQIERIEAGELTVPARLVVRGRPTGPAQPTWPRRGQRRRLALAHQQGPPRADHLEAVRLQPPAECRADPASTAWNAGVEAGARGAGQPPFPSKATDRQGSAGVLRRGALDAGDALVHGASWCLVCSVCSRTRAEQGSG
jgi:hypothetical protein